MMMMMNFSPNGKRSGPIKAGYPYNPLPFNNQTNDND